MLYAYCSRAHRALHLGELNIFHNAGPLKATDSITGDEVEQFMPAKESPAHTRQLSRESEP